MINKKFLLIDTKNAIIKNEFKFQNIRIFSLHDFIPLNDKTFLFINCKIFQFEFQNSKIKLIEERDIGYYENSKNNGRYGLVEKYPDNKLVVYNDNKKIIIYG